ncbi:hypothetical protein [Dysgonomonas sp. 520]|uniref:hypothetical protein n=1 Tax=Dysgonomonas sp. 520 TaxID=2302931 RepID=UPI0013D5EDCC|nr:hypothetical protein [Dysgonomonas sp. 520]NDW09154.1 hypothetical protein [Dysgonomonas sp. 520]
MIHFFNPGHETAVLNESQYYMAPANVVAMQQELALLPAWYASDSDWVFVWNEDDKRYCDSIFNLFDRKINVFSEKDIPLYHHELKCQEVILWGVSPQAIFFWEQLSEKYSLDLNIPKWDRNYRHLCSRNFANLILKEIIEKTGGDNFIIPRFVSSLSEVENILSSEHGRFLAKAPYSSSGRGLLWLPEIELTRTERQILTGMLKKQGEVSIEPVLNKKMDFAMEFMVTENVVNFEGYSVFSTNNKGAYIGNIVDCQSELERKLTAYVDKSIFDNIKHILIELLQKYVSAYYQGCIGVDMMIIEKDGKYLVHPCLEVNMRYNMGYLSLKLFENYIGADSNAFFQIDFSLKKDEILKKHQEMSENMPLNVRKSRITEGYLSLCPITENSKYHAYMIVRKREDNYSPEA